MLSPDLMHGYQQDMIDRLFENNSSLILADMGSGKTIATLTAIAELIEAKVIRRVLVLAPLRVALTVWHAEAANWWHTEHLTVRKALGIHQARRAALESDADIVTMNYENVQWMINTYGEMWFKKLRFDAIVFDEVSRMKNPRSKRFRALRPALSHMVWRAGLTGTPAPNGLMDIFNVAFVCDSGNALGKSFTKFRNTFFNPLDPNGWDWELKPDGEKAIYAALAPTAYALDPADYLTRPEPTIIDITVPMSPLAWTKYKEITDDFYTEHDGESYNVANGGVLVNKQQQLANGFLYNEDKTYVRFDQNKLAACEELVEDMNGKPVIIAYKYRADLDALREIWPSAPNLGAGTGAARSQQIIEDWNLGKVPVLLLHPASAGHGLNLQAGGHHMIWYGITWNSEEYDQAIARIARQGQQNHVYVHRILTEDSVDGRIAASLSIKGLTQDNLIGALL